ncbi:type VII toxin-antitoxin system MntA family adenylyltransferase antitoxin [Alishewanella longhuensis]
MPVINVISAAKLAEQLPKLACLVLIGSRATGKAHQKSDWDFAYFFDDPDEFNRLGLAEELRQQLASTVGCNSDLIDLVDMRCAKLAMRIVIVNEGQLILNQNPQFWFKFQEKTWREHEYWQWEESHAT